MTASVVLNGAKSGTRVSDATRNRILEVAARLRYRPNAVARGLSRLKMDTIGVVSIIQGDEINLYFLEVLNGILAASARLGQNTTVFSIEDWDKDEQRILQFCDGRVDGLIFVGPLFSAAFALTILEYTPMVTLHSSGFMSGTYDLNVDDELGAYNAVRYLISLGHKRIAHLDGGEGTQAGPRRRGYVTAMEAHGLTPQVVPSEYTDAAGARAIRGLIDDGTLPTAIRSCNDFNAVGAISALEDAGLRVPTDVSVVGYDNTSLAALRHVSLTTIDQPRAEFGRLAALALLQRVRDERTEPVRHLLNPSLVVRNTTAPPGGLR